MNDQEIVKELKRFGETVKVPIDKKKRPILIKKLNHYYARENPPPKRGKSPARSPRKPIVTAEFSDDSQDESESANVVTKNGRGRNSTTNNVLDRSQTLRKLRAKVFTADDNAPPSSTSSFNRPRARNVKRKQLSNPQQIEVYPDEFSDNDTADESVYVEEKSIGINTSLNYEDEDDDEEELPSYVESPQNRQSGRYNSGRFSSLSQPNVAVNNISAKNKTPSYLKEERSHFISKTILIIVAIFFFALASCYLFIRRDLFFSHDEAALSSKG